ncbi:MAG: VapC toxin family PIN domain ribonuclease [Cyanobacteria bacterium PR.3.49]|nr:VapC toxin family PIN domain ribonuclease [Cyanobacteria bacterium PR.3.49]
MQYLLDTNVCITLINNRSADTLKRLLACEPGDVALSTITVAELRFGASKSKSAAKNHLALDSFFVPFEIVPFDEQSAIAYGAIRAELERTGKPIGPLDTLLAAQAVAHQLTMVTNNMREFQRVTQLKKIENWLDES